MLILLILYLDIFPKPLPALINEDKISEDHLISVKQIEQLVKEFVLNECRMSKIVPKQNILRPFCLFIECRYLKIQSHATVSVMIKASAASLSQKGNYGL